VSEELCVWAFFQHPISTMMKTISDLRFLISGYAFRSCFLAYPHSRKQPKKSFG